MEHFDVKGCLVGEEEGAHVSSILPSLVTHSKRKSANALGKPTEELGAVLLLAPPPVEASAMVVQHFWKVRLPCDTDDVKTDTGSVHYRQVTSL